MRRRNVINLAVFFAIIIGSGLWRFWLMFKDWKLTKEQLTGVQIQYYRIAQELTDYQNQINTLNQKITALEGNNNKLSKEKQDLEQKLVDLEKEKQLIETKLHSLKELKQAIRQVKIEMHEQEIEQYLVRKAQQEELDAQELAMGNRGFIIKGYQSTYKPKIRIEVKPVN